MGVFPSAKKTMNKIPEDQCPLISATPVALIDHPQGKKPLINP
jgi:hypothetical protein